MRVPGVHAARETGQSVAVHLGVGRQPPGTPVGQRVVVEAARRFEHRVTGMFEGPVGLDGPHERLLAGCAAPAFATVALTTELGFYGM